jgi:regulator of replication initiation timing
LTTQGFSNYSAIMESDLNVLETKLTLLIELCQSLRLENLQLRQDLAQAHDDTKQLKSQMTEASVRLEALIERLPQPLIEGSL